MSQNPLRDELLRAGARLVERDGAEVAADFGDVEGERRAGRAGPAVSDRSARAHLRVAGPDAEKLLQNVLTNDVAPLAAGAALPAFLLTPKGRPVADVRVACLAEREYVVECEPVARDAVLSHLRRYRLAAKVELGDAGGSLAQIALLGHPAPPPADGLVALPVRLGVELLGPVDAVRRAWVDAVAAGARPVGADAFEQLRVEAGVPRQGAEVGDAVLPAETGLVEANVSFSKGCYVGQEPVARLHYRGHPNRGLRRLRLTGPDAPPLPATLVAAGREVGRVTSAAPGLDGAGAVALAYVRREVPDGAVVELIDAGGLRREAVVEPAAVSVASTA